jgi:cell division inhibitor SulA
MAITTRRPTNQPGVPMIVKTLLLGLAALAVAVASSSAQAQQRFVIERDIPGASKMSAEQLRGAAQQSNKVLRSLGPDIQWVHSYVAGDKIYCVYTAPSESLIKEHAKRSGFPANKVTRIAAVIDPTTAR